MRAIRKPRTSIFEESEGASAALPCSDGATEMNRAQRFPRNPGTKTVVLKSFQVSGDGGSLSLYKVMSLILRNCSSTFQISIATGTGERYCTLSECSAGPSAVNGTSTPVSEFFVDNAPTPPP